jgi:hypothetical protein
MIRPRLWVVAALLLVGPSAALAQSSPPAADVEVTGSLPADPRPDQQRENAVALMREWAEDVAYAYLDAWSQENRIALSGLDELYAPRVTFFGRSIGKSTMSAEKRRFADRWPVRRYEHRPGTLIIDCDVEAALCHVRSIIDWEAESPLRHARSGGAAAFRLGVSFKGAKPVVVYETGRVVKIRSASR